MKDTFMNRVAFGSVVTILIIGLLWLIVMLPGLVK